MRSVKDGCSPQGQCGCCTVLVEGAPRVACVTPLRRVEGRDVLTVDGLDRQVRDRLVGAFVAHGASQCGFCTPGIVCRLAALGAADAEKVQTALLAHLCRCTGWRTILDAALTAAAPTFAPHPAGAHDGFDEAAAARRATIEGGAAQQVGPGVVLGRGGFADDTAPPGCLVAVPDGAGGWAVGETLAEARNAAGKVQGRRSGRPLAYPLEVPEGDWDLTLQTTWVEPAYLEVDASWCEPGGMPASPAANGGDFGAKRTSPAPAAARALADRHGRAVRVVLSREDAVRLGAKRPPVAAGIRLDGTGVLRLAAAAEPGVLAAAARSAAPGLHVEEVPVVGPPVSPHVRAAGWAEAAVLLAAARSAGAGGGAAGTATAAVASPEGATAQAKVDLDGRGWPRLVWLEVDAGEPLSEVTLRSYLVGAAHMALGWVLSEGIAVGDDGVPEDLTIRSFGVLRARDTPPVEVRIHPTRNEPKRASDAAFAAVAAAAWIALGLPARWPVRRADTLGR